MSASRRVFRDKESDRIVVMEIEDDAVVDAWWHEGVEGDKWLKYRDWETDRKSTRLNSSHRL